MKVNHPLPLKLGGHYAENDHAVQRERWRGKTLLSTSLARIIQQEANCNVLLVDLDLSVSGLTLLAYHNKIELDQVPLSLIEYLSVDPDKENTLLAALQKGLAMNGEGDGEGQGAQSPSLYRRMENIFILPASTESERPDWTQVSRIDLDMAVEKLGRTAPFCGQGVAYRLSDFRYAGWFRQPQPGCRNTQRHEPDCA